jgi:hypothetical protein
MYIFGLGDAKSRLGILGRLCGKILLNDIVVRLWNDNLL